MRISMLTYTLARQLKGEPFDVERMCEFLQDLGIRDIDWVSTYGHAPEEVRRITDDYGMRNVVHTFTLDAFGPADAAGDAFKRNIDAAVVLGAKIVMIPPKGDETKSREESYGLYVDRLEEVLPVADDAGVTVTVEHFPSPLSPFISSDELNRLCRDVPGVRICFDNGNVTTAGENAGDAFRHNAQFVVHTHFKDFRRCGEDEGRPLGTDGVRRVGTLLGDGEVDQIGCLQAMEDCGYDGCIDFEYEGSEMSAWDATTEGVRRLRQWMGELGIEEG